MLKNHHSSSDKRRSMARNQTTYENRATAMTLLNFPPLPLWTAFSSQRQVQCESGFYCTEGVRWACPPGFYGNVSGLSTPYCSGPCAAGVTRVGQKYSCRRLQRQRMLPGIMLETCGWEECASIERRRGVLLPVVGSRWVREVTLMALSPHRAEEATLPRQAASGDAHLSPRRDFFAARCESTQHTGTRMSTIPPSARGS